MPRLKRIPHRWDRAQDTTDSFMPNWRLILRCRTQLSAGHSTNRFTGHAASGCRPSRFAWVGPSPGRIIQAYALTNLFCWFVLLGALLFLISALDRRATDLHEPGVVELRQRGQHGARVRGPARYRDDFCRDRARRLGWIRGVRGGSAHEGDESVGGLGEPGPSWPWTVAGWKRNVGLLAVASVPMAAVDAILAASFRRSRNHRRIREFRVSIASVGRAVRCAEEYYQSWLEPTTQKRVGRSGGCTSMRDCTKC